MSHLAIKRVLHDITSVTQTNALFLANQGIFYICNESDITKGTALLIGQEGTPYFGGFYFFSVEFPDEYPFSPLRIKSLTQDGHTRYNPNMYKDGKVCLSVLNTWYDGPQWSGVQTLESLLLVLMSDVLSADPLTNEPAYRNAKDIPESLTYSRMVWYANVCMLHKMLIAPPPFALPFHTIMLAEYAKRAPALLSRVTDSLDADGIADVCRIYSMSVTYDFTLALKNLKELKS
jgi:ubiquitin-protein ligase